MSHIKYAAEAEILAAKSMLARAAKVTRRDDDPKCGKPRTIVLSNCDDLGFEEPDLGEGPTPRSKLHFTHYGDPMQIVFSGFGIDANLLPKKEGELYPEITYEYPEDTPTEVFLDGLEFKESYLEWDGMLADFRNRPFSVRFLYFTHDEYDDHFHKFVVDFAAGPEFDRNAILHRFVMRRRCHEYTYGDSAVFCDHEGNSYMELAI